VQRTGFPVRLVKEPAIVSFRTEKRRFQMLSSDSWRSHRSGRA